MGAAASFQESEWADVGDKITESECKAHAVKLGLAEQDWPEEKWQEIASEEGYVTKEQFMSATKDIMGGNSQPEEAAPEEAAPAPEEATEETPAVEAAADSADVDATPAEEVIAENGEQEQSLDPELAQGTFNEEKDDGEPTLLVPDMELVGTSPASPKTAQSATSRKSDSEQQPAEEEGEIIAADGELGDSKGPGCFDEDQIQTDGTQVTDLIVSGSSSPTPEPEDPTPEPEAEAEVVAADA